MKGESSIGAVNYDEDFMGRRQSGRSPLCVIVGVEELSALGDMGREGLGVKFDVGDRESDKSALDQRIQMKFGGL